MLLCAYYRNSAKEGMHPFMHFLREKRGFQFYGNRRSASMFARLGMPCIDFSLEEATLEQLNEFEFIVLDVVTKTGEDKEMCELYRPIKDGGRSVKSLDTFLSKCLSARGPTLVELGQFKVLYSWLEQNPHPSSRELAVLRMGMRQETDELLEKVGFVWEPALAKRRA